MADQFNFYSFGLNLNKDQIYDIPEKAYLKLCHSKILDMSNELEAVHTELAASRKMTRQFRVN